MTNIHPAKSPREMRSKVKQKVFSSVQQISFWPGVKQEAAETLSVHYENDETIMYTYEQKYRDFRTTKAPDSKLQPLDLAMKTNLYRGWLRSL